MSKDRRSSQRAEARFLLTAPTHLSDGLVPASISQMNSLLPKLVLVRVSLTATDKN